MKIAEMYWLTSQEIKQREEEGCAVADLREKHKAGDALDEADKRNLCESILSALAALAPDPNYVEPSDLEAIRAQRPDGPRRMQNAFSLRDLFERTYGGWLGRCAGCLLGKPVESWSRPMIRAVAAPDANYPLKDYFSAITPQVVKHRRTLTSANPCLRGQIVRMERDDDLDYTITGLLLLEQHGFDLTTAHVGAFWLSEFPYSKVYTAERIAYRNLVDGIPASQAGEILNPCREWIGAQIRADAFGYVCPAWPERAAELGYRDAYLSHRKNGIYGEMLVAAMIAAAYVEPSIEKIIEIGLSEIPKASRLAEAVRRVIDWWNGSKDWEKVSDKIDEHYGGLQGCHTITNAAVVILGLLAGAEDFTAGLSASVMPGYDTDCNGATAGSILGVRCGAARIPPHWTEPLNDTVRTLVASVQEARISDLARRTVRLVEQDLDAANTAETSFGPITWGI
jgi:ADP-ribosylglycohydrolase